MTYTKPLIYFALFRASFDSLIKRLSYVDRKNLRQLLIIFHQLHYNLLLVHLYHKTDAFTPSELFAIALSNENKKYYVSVCFTKNDT